MRGSGVFSEAKSCFLNSGWNIVIDNFNFALLNILDGKRISINRDQINHFYFEKINFSFGLTLIFDALDFFYN